MNENVQAQMREATRLVGLGRLGEATASIQRALAGTPADTPLSTKSKQYGKAPLDGSFTVVENGETDAPVPSPATARASTTGDPEIVVPPPRFPFARAQTWQRPTPTDGAERVREAGSGAQFLAGSFAGATGTRGYKLYVPSSYSGGELPLLVMLHGCTQSPDDTAAGTGFNRLAEERGWLVLYPAQTQGANAQRCWNWFKAGDQHRDSGECALLAGMTRNIMATYAVDPRRVYAAGLSAGGAMAVVLGATHADLFAAIGVHSGLAHRVAHDLPSALAAMHGGLPAASAAPSKARAQGSPLGLAVPTIVFHGDRDTTVSPANGERVIAQCAAALSGETPLRIASSTGQVPGGHAYTRRVYENSSGMPVLEHWLVHGAGHAWSGGHAGGSYVDPRGPSATHEMMRFFAAHPRGPMLGQGASPSSGP